MRILVLIAAFVVLPIASALAEAGRTGTLVFDGDATYSGLVAAPAAGGAVSPLVSSAQYSAISPDGRTVALALREQGTGEGGGELRLATMPVTGGTPRVLATIGAVSSAPAWSPDGRQIAYATDHALLTVSAHGGRPLPLVRVPDDMLLSSPAYRPDGRLLYLSSRSQSGPTGTPAVQLRTVGGASIPVRLPSPWQLDSGSLDVSPSGRTLLLSVQQPPQVDADDETVGTPLMGAAMVSVRGGAATVISGPTLPAFSPDGKQLCGTVYGAQGPMIVLFALNGQPVAAPPEWTGDNCSWGR